MIIISKEKDFYDYFVGIYGRDEKKVFDRRCCVTKPYNDDELFPKDEKDFRINATTKDGKPYIKRVFAILSYIYDIEYHVDKSIVLKVCYEDQHTYWRDTKFKRNKRQTTLNRDKRFPMLLKIDNNHWEPIIMKNYLLNKVFNADDIYRGLDLFLGYLVDNPEKPDNQTNDDKIVSGGFDMKTSFRGKIKK